jgi:hypothetical protein
MGGLLFSNMRDIMVQRARVNGKRTLQATKRTDGDAARKVLRTDFRLSSLYRRIGPKPGKDFNSLAASNQARTSRVQSDFG